MYIFFVQVLFILPKPDRKKIYSYRQRMSFPAREIFFIAIRFIFLLHGHPTTQENKCFPIVTVYTTGIDGFAECLKHSAKP
jgi:hypothetical protein